VWRGIVDAVKVLQRVAVTQGAFYLATGVWPLIDIDSFQAVTGPKVDLWLVRTVGVLVSVIGVVLITAARRRRIGLEVALLAVGSALGLATIDAVYALSGVISPVYLADAVVELALVAAWILCRRGATS
jgi:energy-converting hydrogenase Eha subunit E